MYGCMPRAGLNRKKCRHVTNEGGGKNHVRYDVWGRSIFLLVFSFCFLLLESIPWLAFHPVRSILHGPSSFHLRSNIRIFISTAFLDQPTSIAVRYHFSREQVLLSIGRKRWKKSYSKVTIAFSFYWCLSLLSWYVSPFLDIERMCTIFEKSLLHCIARLSLTLFGENASVV